MPKRWYGRTTPILATRRPPTMGRASDEINIGQLCREEFGGDAVLIGFGTDRGSVAAADDWDGPMKIKTVRQRIPKVTSMPPRGHPPLPA
jgi:erythromycin esterase-like protein